MTEKTNEDRFGDRVNVYVQARPSYPAEVLELLRERFDLAGRPTTIIDLGSGSGIFSKQILDALPQTRVFGVEPNQHMREASEEALKDYLDEGRFISVAGAAETTGLPDHSADAIVAATAFHWFDAEETRKECLRLLRTSDKAGVALMWNHRQGMKAPDEATPFMAGYERLLQQHSEEYASKDSHSRVSTDVLDKFFGADRYQSACVANPYRLSFDQLRDRMLSSSYSPHPGQAGYGPLMAGLDRLYQQHERKDEQRWGIDFLYDTRVVYGKMQAMAAEIDFAVGAADDDTVDDISTRQRGGGGLVLLDQNL